MITDSEFVRNYDWLMLDGEANRLYGDSGFFNVGYWLPSTNDQLTACETLIKRLLKPVPATAKRVLDVACGCGGVTRCLKNHFPAGEVIGINISMRQLQNCRVRAHGCDFALMDAAQIAFRHESFDCVVCVEAAFHFNTRKSFVKDAWRILRPGGFLVISDILFHNATWIGAWMMPTANIVSDLKSYRSLFTCAGFPDAKVVDATEECWNAFCRHHMRWTEIDFRAGKTDEKSYKARMYYLEGLLYESLGYYILLTAQKPVIPIP